MANNKLQIFFLPWIGDRIKESIKIGSITFWPYPDEADKRITEAETKNKLNEFFKRFVNLKGEPVGKVVMCSYKDEVFHEFTLKEYYEMRNAVNALIFSAITSQTVSAVKASPSGRYFPPPNSNVFELASFVPGNDFILTSDGVWELSDIAFQNPIPQGGKLWGYNKEIIKCFDICFSKRRSEVIKGDISRLTRSLEWFKLAHTEDNLISYNTKTFNEEVSYPSKIVMMATAFEILFNLPNYGKGKKFTKKVEDCIRKSTAKTLIEEIRTDEEKKNTNRTRAGWWAWDFYQLRNGAVHGNAISPSDLIYKENWITYPIVADLVYLVCVENLLIKNNCIDDKMKSSIKRQNKLWSIPFPIQWTFNLEPIYKILGWIKNNDKPDTQEE